MHRDSGITQHRFWTRCRHNDLFIRILNRIGKRRDYTELEFLLRIVSGDVQQRSAGQLLLLDFKVGQSRIQSNTPVDEAVCSIDDAVLS